MSGSQIVHYCKSDGVGMILFDRPPANAYEIQFMECFAEAIDVANADKSVNAVIVASVLEKFFCAGSDIKVFQANDTVANESMVERARAALRRINDSDKIFIAVLNGHTLGGGLEIALACDLRFAAEGDYLLGLPEVKLGLIPGNGGTQRLARVVGASHALDLLASGRSVMPQEALQMGLVNRLIPGDQLREEAMAYARQLNAGPALAIAALKKSVLGGLEMSLEKGLAWEQQLVKPLYNTQDASEGFAAFIEKRNPNFIGR